MTTAHATTCYFELPGGRRVEIGMTIIEDPLIPTPNEPDIERAPALHEWPEICQKLAAMDVRFERLKTVSSSAADELFLLRPWMCDSNA
jgi:hypothetical protein